MSRTKEKRAKTLHGFLLEIVLGFVVSGVLFLIWSDDLGIPFGFWSPWSWGEGKSLIDGLTAVWPLYIWGIGLTFLAGILNIVSGKTRSASVGQMLRAGTILSVLAGVTEEIAYRWIRFMGAIFGIYIMNWLLLGFVGFDIVKWAYTEALVPVSNWLTLGYLEPQLLYMGPWLIGAAIVSANGDFRDEHRHLGLFGYVNSWFGGMVLFWVMFNYGLVAAILAHVLYDLGVFWTRAVMAGFLKYRNPSLDRLSQAILESLLRSPRR